MFIPELSLAIEYDGYFYHKDKLENDIDKMHVSSKIGIQILRIRETGLPPLSGFEAFCYECDGDQLSTLNMAIKNVFPYILDNFTLNYSILQQIQTIDVDAQRHRLAIYESYLIAEKDKNLATPYPDLCKEWHPTKNGKLLPDYFTKGSNEKVWWICEQGHEWESVIAHRANGKRCPYCVRLKASDENNLTITHPHLIAEWNYEKNGDLLPQDILSGTKKYVWWVCSKGHEWSAPIKQRVSQQSGGPYCSGHRVHAENSLAALYPEVAKDWHPSKNGILTPDTVHAFSRTMAWFMCENGHEIHCKVMERTRMKGCLYCAGRYLTQDTCLATVNPQVAFQWHPTKNGSVSPQEVFPNSYKEAWWICEKKHEWVAVISSRNQGSGCPYCSNQKVGDDNHLALTVCAAA